MTDAQKKFVLDLEKNCDTHEQWITLVSFGLPTLLKDQAFLIKLIVNHASSLSGPDSNRQAEFVVKIFDDLELKFY